MRGVAAGLLVLAVLGCNSEAAVAPDAAPRPDGGFGGDAIGADPEAGLCHGDVPCALVRAVAPDPGCAAAGANAGYVVSTAPSVTGYAESALALPAEAVRVKEPDFHTCLTRATPRGWMNGYSRFGAFNADATRLLVRQAGGAWFLLDAGALGAPTRALPPYGDEAAPRWHGRDPDVLFYLDGPRLVRYQVTPGTSTVALDLAAVPGLAGCGGVAAVSLGGSEGDGSAASRFWGFQVVTIGTCHGHDRHFVTADLERGETFVHTLPAGVDLPDNSSMSLTGAYFVANFQERPCDADGTLARPCGVMAYTVRLDAAFMVHPSAGHHDEALGRDGHDVVVVKSNSTDFIEAVDLETGALTTIAALNLDAQAWDYHVSGNSWAAPGWVLLSEDSHDVNGHYLNRQIAAVELKDLAVARVVHLAHHRTRSTEYWTQESHATVNADFTRVAFHSNWYGGADESENMLFFLELPPGFLGGL
ncbi:MAG TPA: hypothetical protein VGQ83_07615 [Polyangia bacterium]